MKNDERIKKLLNKIGEQKKTLGKKPKVSLITNGLFKYGNQDHFNINVVTDPYIFVNALAWMRQRFKSHIDAANRLKIEPYFKVGGYTVDNWEEDFKTRLEIINYNKRKKLLDETKKKLNSLVSEETRTEMTLDDIEEIFK